jgi:hypothetical protein
MNGVETDVGRGGPHCGKNAGPVCVQQDNKRFNDHLWVTFGQNNPGRLNCPQARAAEPRPRRQDVHCNSFQALQRGNDGNESGDGKS